MAKNKQKRSPDLILEIDGASRGNPGEAGCGAVIRKPDGKVVQEMLEYLGRTTNNVAEYRALLLGLSRALALGARHVRILSDSELLVKQVRGEYRVRKAHLFPLFYKARELLGNLTSFEITHIPREQNRLADQLANRAIDECAEGDQTIAGSPFGEREESPDSTGQDGR